MITNTPAQGTPNILTSTYTTNTTGATNMSIVSSMYGSRIINSSQDSNTLLTLHDSKGTPILSVDKSGVVTWKAGYEIDQAAEAFAQAMQSGVEKSVGITSAIKSRMRDSMFNDLIAIAKEKGPLSAKELEYLLSASKIIEQLS